MGLVLIDEDLLKKGLVEKAAGYFVCFEVSGVAVPGQVEYLSKVRSCPFVVCFSRRQSFPDKRKVERNSFLLRLKELDGNSASVVRFEQFLALSGQAYLLFVEVHSLGGSCILQGFKFFENVNLKLVPQLGPDADGAVFILDELFEMVHQHGLTRAVTNLPEPARADVVGVGGATAILYVR